MHPRARWLAPALLVMAVASCSADDGGGGDGGHGDVRRTDATSDARGDAAVDRCAPGVDSDGDGLTNDLECMLGSDPMNADSDMDGVRDGTEARYPRICVADDRAQQRRPPPACTMDSECNAGEHCRGLDPSQSDSDMDGVADGMEDMGLDGMFDVSMGETDPRLWDTDGDGTSDGMGGLDICRPAGLATVTQVDLPMGPTQVGYDPRWGASRAVTGTMSRGGVLLDDTTENVAGAVFYIPSVGDVRAEQMRVETAITAAIGTGVTPVLVGRALTTHEMQPATTSTYRVMRTTTASALRDAIVMPLIGAAAPAGGPSVGMSTEFLLDVTTVRRTSGAAINRTDVIVGISPRALYEDNARATAIRVNDLVNSTGVAESGKQLGSTCQVFHADRVAMADFLWTVDTSGSMGDDQMRLGNVAVQFFNGLNAAGVDFRVGVLQAGSTTLNLDTPGFRFINGTDAMGARALCEQVTSASLGMCPTSTTDTLSPYAFAGSQEEPTAAAVLAHFEFHRRSMAGETNADRRFRTGARVVTFGVTDEPGSNDFSRYFASHSDPQTMVPWGTAYNAATLSNIIAYFHRNEVLTFGLVPVSTTACSAAAVADLPRCVIEGNGGAVIPITTATAPEIAAAMTRIVEAVAGATSQFQLTRSPITSTIQVRVRGMNVPRSRASGFDYDPASRSIIFYGSMFRPAMGDQVVISYRIWEGSLG